MTKKFSKRVENIVGKEEIARNEQFLLFPQCFQKSGTADTQKPGLIWERVKSIFHTKSLLGLSISLEILSKKKMTS